MRLYNLFSIFFHFFFLISVVYQFYVFIFVNPMTGKTSKTSNHETFFYLFHAPQSRRTRIINRVILLAGHFINSVLPLFNLIMANYKTCDECNGTGIADYCTFEGDYSVDYKADCNECDGSGEINTRKYFLDENE